MEEMRQKKAEAVDARRKDTYFIKKPLGRPRAPGQLTGQLTGLAGGTKTTPMGNVKRGASCKYTEVNTNTTHLKVMYTNTDNGVLNKRHLLKARFPS